MVAVVVTLAVVLVVAAVVALAVVAAGKSRKAVVSQGTQHGRASSSVTVQPESRSTGAVEVAAAAPPELFDLDLDLAPVAATAPSPASAAVTEVVGPAAAIRWSKQFDPRSGVLDDTARLRLIGDLGVVGKEWCVPLLCQAYTEEQRPANRQAALIALAICRSRTAVPTYELALTSGDAGERAIATDALSDLEPPAVAKRRTVIERR